MIPTRFDHLAANFSVSWKWRWMRWQRQLKGAFTAVRHPGRSEFSVAQLIILLNLILFTLMVLQGTAAGRGFRPLLNPDTGLLLHAGGQYWPRVFGEGEWWRCVTYAFTHGGLIHLAFNMLVLYQVGPLLEYEVGKARFLFLYVFTAITGTVAGLLWHPIVPVVGASGAIFGLIGFAAAYNHRMGDSIALQRRNFMLQWAAYAFIFGLLVGADNAGHLGGAIGGAIFGFLLPIRGTLVRKTDPLFNILGIASAVVIAGSLGLLVLSWFR